MSIAHQEQIKALMAQVAKLQAQVTDMTERLVVLEKKAKPMGLSK